jgi:arabinose-5-phosphate isomerase
VEKKKTHLQSENNNNRTTDGEDLRRPSHKKFSASEISTIHSRNEMTPDPKTISPDALVASALEMLNSATILALFVVENGKPAGIIHLHDLLKIGAA